MYRTNCMLSVKVVASNTVVRVKKFKGTVRVLRLSVLVPWWCSPKLWWCVVGHKASSPLQRPVCIRRHGIQRWTVVVLNGSSNVTRSRLTRSRMTRPPDQSRCGLRCQGLHSGKVIVDACIHSANSLSVRTELQEGVAGPGVRSHDFFDINFNKCC